MSIQSLYEVRLMAPFMERIVAPHNMSRTSDSSKHCQLSIHNLDAQRSEIEQQPQTARGKRTSRSQPPLAPAIYSAPLISHLSLTTGNLGTLDSYWVEDDVAKLAIYYCQDGLSTAFCRTIEMGDYRPRPPRDRGKGSPRPVLKGVEMGYIKA